MPTPGYHYKVTTGTDRNKVKRRANFTTADLITTHETAKHASYTCNFHINKVIENNLTKPLFLYTLVLYM